MNTKCNKRHQCLSVFCCTSYSLLCIFDFGAINKKYIEIDDCFFINVAGSLLFKDTRTRLWQLEQYTSSPSSQVVLEYLEGAPFPFWFFPLILNQTKQFYHRRNFKGQPTLGIVSNRLQLMFFFYSQTVRTRLEIVYIPPSQVGRLCYPREPCKPSGGEWMETNNLYIVDLRLIAANQTSLEKIHAAYSTSSVAFISAIFSLLCLFLSSLCSCSS